MAFGATVGKHPMTADFAIAAGKRGGAGCSCRRAAPFSSAKTRGCRVTCSSRPSKQDSWRQERGRFASGPAADSRDRLFDIEAFEADLGVVIERFAQSLIMTTASSFSMARDRSCRMTSRGRSRSCCPKRRLRSNHAAWAAPSESIPPATVTRSFAVRRSRKTSTWTA